MDINVNGEGSNLNVSGPSYCSQILSSVARDPWLSEAECIEGLRNCTAMFLCGFFGGVWIPVVEAGLAPRKARGSFSDGSPSVA